MRSLPALFLLALPLVIASISATACSGKQSLEADDSDAGDTNPVVTPATTTGTASSPAPVIGPAGTGLATGLPCDVQGVLENRCLACHGSPPTNGAPVSLLTYDDLAAKSITDPSKSRAEIALQLMQAKQMPPAPAVPPDDDEIAAFATWVQAGAPKNNTACTDPPPPAVDGGLPDGGAIDGGSVCLSGTFWKNGNDGSQLMHPGGACLTCHQLNDGPNLRVAGTVFKGPHEPDDCNGAAPPPALTVIITDSRNQNFRLPVNTAGNFLTTQKVRPPLRAQVTDGTNTRKMNGSVTSGDCNSCHTVAGANGAPGRILAP